MEFSCCAVMALLLSDIAVAATRTYHDGYRSNVAKLDIHPGYIGKTGDPKVVAEEYLKNNFEIYGLKKDLSDLRVQKIKKSLTRTIVYFEQMYGTVPVRHAKVIVSVSDKTNEVTRVFNNYQPNINVVELDKTFKGPLRPQVITVDQAYDAAWNDIKVHGRLLDDPSLKASILVDDSGAARLVFESFLNVEEPLGAWVHLIDAKTGKIIKREDTRLERKPTTKIDPRFYNGPVADRRDSFMQRQFTKLRYMDSVVDKSLITATGSAKVFDPDPRTTLQRNDLQDESPAAEFETAYFDRDLKDLTVVDGVYTLKGPWVHVTDFESPSTAPSTSATGKWEAKRGNNSFNDAMTYFHLDQSQRYMQSLGYTGERGIQNVSIEVDTDGVGGQDNSHYIPGSNKLAFGHGCVDDNEDADVILHEYGHAIHTAINEDWNGGDTGAMGEGFGDYWAASYSYSTPNGKTFGTNEVFTWDGHGEGNTCWSGRSLNAREVNYDATRTYDAHERIEGGRQSDELWSTPVFQAFLELMSAGVTREQVDTIVLEAQFGLGAGLKMRDMASAMVATAQELYPAGPHATVFSKYFRAQKILEAPHAKIVMNKITLPKDLILPGDEIKFNVGIRNSGSLSAMETSISLSSDSPGVIVANPEVQIGEVKAGASANVADQLSIAIDSGIECGAKVDALFSLSFLGGLSGERETITQSMEARVGRALTADASSGPIGIIVPDNKPEGVKAELNVDAAGKVTGSFSISVEIKHDFPADLEVDLVSPTGKKVILHNRRTARGLRNIQGTYPTTLTPIGNLADLVGEDLRGKWTLELRDVVARDEGTLLNWSINDVTGYDCNR